METSCVRHSLSRIAVHLDLPTPKHDKFCAAIRDLGLGRPRMVACAHPLAWLFPTAACLRLSRGMVAVTKTRFKALSQDLIRNRQDFAIASISTAPVLYGLAESWRHVVGFLYSADGIEIVDPIQLFDDRLAPVQLDPLDICGNIDVICVLLYK